MLRKTTQLQLINLVWSMSTNSQLSHFKYFYDMPTIIIEKNHSVINDID